MKLRVRENFFSVLYFSSIVTNVRAEEKRIELDDIILSSYNNFSPPKNNSTVPVSVGVSITKLRIRTVDENDMSISVSLELWQNWEDSRLVFPSWIKDSFTTLDSNWIDKIWSSKLYFRNAIDGKLNNIISPSNLLWLVQANDVYYCCRIYLKLLCEMDLKYFPHDKQVCAIRISSSLYSTKDVILTWMDKFKNNELESLQQFDIVDLKRENELIAFTDSSNISCLQLKISLQRRSGYYLINVYIPTILIVAMSMLTFWIPADAVPARITLGVTSLLTIITKQYQAAMPNVSYIVALNVWLSSCIAFVFFSLLEYAAVIAFASSSRRSIRIPRDYRNSLLPMVMLKSNGTWAMKNSSLPKAENLLSKRLDYASRLFFPLAFGVFTGIYWKFYS